MPSEEKQQLDELLGLKKAEKPGRLAKSLKEEIRAPDDILDATWQKLDQELFAIEKKMEVKKKPAKIVYLVPLAAAAVAFIVVMFNLPGAKQDSTMFVDAATGEKRSLDGNYSQSGANLVKGSFGPVTIWHRELAELGASTNENEINFNLTGGDLIFSYEKNENNQILNITTPQAKYQVLGTEFFLRVREDKEELTVARGVVRVIHNSATHEIKAGQHYSTKLSAEKSISRENIVEVEKTFAIFKEHGQSIDALNSQYNRIFLEEKEEAPPNLEKKSKKAVLKVIELKSGQIFTGRISRQNSDTITLLIEPRNQPVTIRRDDIKSINTK